MNTKTLISLPMQNFTLTLLGTSHCHLCEEAASIVKLAIGTLNLSNEIATYKQVDIIEHPQLYELFALKIPVLHLERNQTYQEIFWPFTDIDVIKLINNV